jgi:hypothetical protein
VPSGVLGFNVSFWQMVSPVDLVAKLEHTLSQVPNWALTGRKQVTHWDFMDPPYRPDTHTPPATHAPAGMPPVTPPEPPPPPYAQRMPGKSVYYSVYFLY